MKITLSPQVSIIDDTPPTVIGNTILYRGAEYDLSQLPIDSQVEADSPFVGLIKNNAGEIEVVLEYRYSTDTAEPMQSTNWDDYTFIVVDGECPCPIKRKPVPKEVTE